MLLTYLAGDYRLGAHIAAMGKRVHPSHSATRSTLVPLRGVLRGVVWRSSRGGRLQPLVPEGSGR